MGWVVNTTPQLLYPRERDPVPIVREAGWVPGPVWTGAENLAPTRIRSPDRLARSQLLYRLSYRSPVNEEKLTYFLGKTETESLQYMKCSEVHTNIVQIM
jgi:hypothetical protein